MTSGVAVAYKLAYKDRVTSLDTKALKELSIHQKVLLRFLSNIPTTCIIKICGQLVRICFQFKVFEGGMGEAFIEQAKFREAVEALQGGFPYGEGGAL